MHPIVFKFMIKEHIKDLTAELERARIIASVQKESHPPKKTKWFSGKQPGIWLRAFLSGKR